MLTIFARIAGDWSLQLQVHRVPLLAQPGGGYHAEAPIQVAADSKVYILWEALFPKSKAGGPGVAWDWELAAR